MTDTGFSHGGEPFAFAPSPVLPAVALSGVRSRRLLAFGFDFLLVSIFATMLWISLVVLTFGVALVFLPPLWPIVAFAYNGFTVSGRRMATPGMRLFDLEMRMVDGAPVSFLVAGLHAVLLYLSWMFPPIFLLSLVAPGKRCLHDICAGVIVVRRPA